ncbi:MAG: transcription termination/antitermination protein NusA [Tenericutes bacterium HGW-Tenericutes-4]|nr:MAG: transcription termination/antitermination protein NusA [Tenericutes bacterium HGW-Tenericutes-4]
MVNKDFFKALEELEQLRRIKREYFIEALEAALTSAYKKNYGEGKSATVVLSPEKGIIKIYSYKTVVEEVENPDKEISLEEAKGLKANAKLGDKIQEEEKPRDFGRIAAQTAKQVIMQKLREAEKDVAMVELAEKEDQLITSIVRRIDEKNIYVEIGASGLEAAMSEQDQIPGERYHIGDRIKIYVKKIKDSFQGPLVQVSRANTGFVRRLFELEVPEIASGEIVIHNIVREAGYRTKIAVYTENKNLDPVGACVGNKGMRINTIVAELNGEKIDIIPYSDNPQEFIANALSPAEVLAVEILGEKESRAIVPDNKLSLAIGKSGQNVRLAAKLTGWKIDVKPQSQGYEKVEETEEEIEEEIVEVQKVQEEISEPDDLDNMFLDDMETL